MADAAIASPTWQQRIKLPPRFAAWLAVCAQFGSVQIVVQILSLGSGILLVRWLDKPQYATFTIFGMVQGTMNLLADNGISMALMAEGGRVCHDRTAFGRLINSALPIRRMLGAVATLIMLPAGYWLLRGRGASVPITFALLVCLVAGFHFILVSGVLGVVPKLLRQVTRLQKLDILSAVGRLTLLGLLAWLFTLNAVTAAVIGVMAAVVQWLVLRRWSARDVDLNAPASPAERKAILAVVKRVTPNTIFYCIQGQLTLWLISLFASADKVAEVGALGRLAVVFAVFGSVLTSVIAPAFARCQDRARLLNAYFYVVGSFACSCGLAFLLALLFPGQLLWVLGRNYAHLHDELLLMIGTTLLSAITSTIFTLNSARAWVEYSWLYIPLTLFTQAISIGFFNVGTIRGALWFGLLSNVPAFLLNIGLSIRGFRRSWNEPMPA